MKLEGTLDIFSLRELIEMSMYSSVIGVLNIDTPRGMGQIFFRDGEAYHCTYQYTTGEDALLGLFEQREGSFTFVADASAKESSLGGDIHRLMDECEVLAERWRVVRTQLPDVHVVPHFVRDPGVDHLRIATTHFAMLSGIDGERTLAEIAHELSLDLLDVCEAAIILHEDGLIDLRAAHVRPALVAPPKAQSGSVIDRILSTLPLRGGSSAPDPLTQRFVAPTLLGDEDPILRLLRN